MLVRRPTHTIRCSLFDFGIRKEAVKRPVELDTRQKNLLLLYNNDLLTVQTRDEQEETKTKVKQTRDQTAKGERYHTVLGQCAVACNLETVMAGIVMIITKA